MVFLIIINISISKAFENNTLCKDEHEAKSRVKRVINNFDPENVFLSVWGPKAISVQLTDQVGWNSFRIFGYLVGGKAPFIIDRINLLNFKKLHEATWVHKFKTKTNVVAKTF